MPEKANGVQLFDSFGKWMVACGPRGRSIDGFRRKKGRKRPGSRVQIKPAIHLNNGIPAIRSRRSGAIGRLPGPRRATAHCFR
jgi:hypothetical protein